MVLPFCSVVWFDDVVFNTLPWFGHIVLHSIAPFQVMSGVFMRCCRFFRFISFINHKTAGIIRLLNKVKPKISRFFNRFKVICNCCINKAVNCIGFYMYINTGYYHGLVFFSKVNRSELIGQELPPEDSPQGSLTQESQPYKFKLNCNNGGPRPLVLYVLFDLEISYPVFIFRMIFQLDYFIACCTLSRSFIQSQMIKLPA